MMRFLFEYNVNKDRYLFKKESVNFFINVGFQVTRKCNLSCIRCCESGQIDGAPLEKIKTLIDKLACSGMKKICITGGEPLLREDLPEIVKHAHEMGLFVTLSTNALLLDEKKLLAIKPNIHNIRFSLHGKQNTHDNIVGHSGHFQKVIQSMKLANQMEIPVSVVSPIIQENHAEMHEIAEICEKNRVEKLYFFSLILRGRGLGLEKQAVQFSRIAREFAKISVLAKKNSYNLDLNIIDWSIEEQCCLVFPNGDLAGVPSFNYADNTRIVGNFFEDSAESLWAKYPFKENYLNYYKNH